MVISNEYHSNNLLGVFDSGMGGLTVVNALRKVLPHTSILYVADTARVPYGSKSQNIITQYSKEIIACLLKNHVKIIIAACHTASALALPILKQSISVPLIGVIEPGCLAAVQQTRNGHIGVIATVATVASQIYRNTIRRMDATIKVTELACPLLVPLIEEGLLDDPITKSIIHRYINPMLSNHIDTLILGCTHYPLLKNIFSQICGSSVNIIDSAKYCARTISSLFSTQIECDEIPQLHIILTDYSERLIQLAEDRFNLSINSVMIEKDISYFHENSI